MKYFALFTILGICFLTATTLAQDKKKQKEKPAKAKKVSDESYVYKKVDGVELKIFVTKPDDWKTTDKRPAAVFYHGGGWVGGSPGQFTQHSSYLASRGMVCFQVQYRLLKKTPGPPIHCVRDAKSAMRWVRRRAQEFGIDPGRIASGGGSAGGHLAAFVGMVEGNDDPADDTSVSAKSNALLLFNPVYDNGPDDGWGTARVGDRYQEFSPAHNITKDDPPAIVFLGTQDKLIPVETAKRFQQKMKAVDLKSELVLFEGQGHGFFNYGKGDGSAYYDTVIATDKFLASLGWLKGEPTIKRPAN